MANGKGTFRAFNVEAMMSIQNLIGDYKAFFADLLQRMQKQNIHITGLPLSHFTYRVETLSEYVTLRDALLPYCSEFVETQFNGRAVAIHILKNPLILGEGFEVSLIELPAPRSVHMYPSGLESFGVVMKETFSAFKLEHESALTGIKDHGEHCQPAFITYENGKTAKFYDISLKDIVNLQGWKLESLRD